MAHQKNINLKGVPNQRVPENITVNSSLPLVAVIGPARNPFEEHNAETFLRKVIHNCTQAKHRGLGQSLFIYLFTIISYFSCSPLTHCLFFVVVLDASVMAGIITQVSQTPLQANIQPPLLTRLSLELRGKRFSVDRETIMNLPESVLLCLFPNGLVLSRQATSLGDGGENSEEEEVYGVDVRP